MCNKLGSMPVGFEQRYAQTLGDGVLRDGACFSWVRELSPEQALRRLGLAGPLRSRTLEDVDGLVGALFEARTQPVGAVAGSLGEWTLVVEPNGFAATITDALAALSAGTEAVSVFWNVSGLAELAVSRDGQTVAHLRDLVFFVDPDGHGAQSTLADVEGSDPATVGDLVATLGQEKSYRWEPAVFSWVERHTGARLPKGWLEAPHLGGAAAKAPSA